MTDSQTSLHKPQTAPMGAPTRLYRLIVLFLHLLRGLVKVTIVFPFLSQDSRSQAITRWSQCLCRILNVRLVIHGSTPTDSTRHLILIANHISWLDIFVLNAIFASRFVAKAEVRRWPLVGWLCRQTGTLFISREKRHDTRRINQQIVQALNAGDCISIFPEGSTTDGQDVARFNASLFQPAIEKHAPIQPVAIRYTDAADQYSRAAAYIDEMSLLDSLWQLAGTSKLVANVHFLDRLHAHDTTRRELASLAESRIRDVVTGQHAANPARQLADSAPGIPDHLPA